MEEFMRNYCHHHKTPTLEPLFNRVASMKASNFIKKKLQHMEQTNSPFISHVSHAPEEE